MPQCPHCSHEFAISAGFACPSCGADYRQAPSASDATDRPAHLSVLEGSDAPPSSSKPRLVSSAGPSVPVMQKQDDSVPSGWMARLEAARMVASSSGGVETTSSRSEPLPPGGGAAPPPLKKSGKKKNGLETKPAHLLVAQLEQEETKRRAAEVDHIEHLFTTDNTDEISSVHVDVPVEARTKRKKIPDWLVGLVIVGVVGVGGYFAYITLKKAPTPVAEVDPKLAKAVQRRRQAMETLEAGHEKAVLGKDGAQEAIVLYNKALELEPNLAGAERGLASAYAALADKKSAVEHYKRYLKMKPKAKDAADVKEIIDDYEKSQKK